MRKFRSYLNRENFDYSTGLVNPYEFHKTFYWFSKVFCTIDNEPLEKKYILLHTLFVISLIISLFLVMLDAYNAYRTMEIMLWTQVIAYTILFSYTLMILISQRRDLRYYHSLQRALRDDFLYICTEGQHYRERFFESQLGTWKLCVACLFFSISGVILASSSFFLLFYYLATHDPDDENDPGRPLLFPIWFFDVDPTATPTYEIVFCFTLWTTVVIGNVYNFMKQNEITWVRQITARADLIIYAIEDLKTDLRSSKDPVKQKQYDDSLRKRFRNIVKRHHDMYSLLEDFAGVYRKMLLYEQKLGGPLMCMCAYVSTELYGSSREFNPVLLILFLATFNVCLIPSYMCTFLGNKIRSICDACWNTPFWNASPIIRPYMVLLMQRSLRPLPLQAPGFEVVSLETFATRMSAAYSMFNMLRHTDIGKMQ